MLVIMDYLTKWAQSYPMAKANTTTTARHLMEWVYQMAHPAASYPIKVPTSCQPP